MSAPPTKSGPEPVSAFDLKSYLDDRRRRVDRALRDCLPSAEVRPGKLHEAMRYSLFAGGKRLRPILSIAAFEAAAPAVPLSDFFPALCAIELVHTYSLMHDDLPAMDNDDFRRGWPTCHKKFGEATAILAGDALLTAAFELLSDPARAPGLPPETRLAMMQELASASGSLGMVGGQQADIEAESAPPAAFAEEDVRFIHERKTGRLIRAAVRVGAMAGGAAPEALAALTIYGEKAGLAFQIADDILDVEGTEAETGKKVGKDGAQNKRTYPGAVGIEASRKLARTLTAEASAALDVLGSAAEPLRAIAGYIVERKA